MIVPTAALCEALRAPIDPVCIFGGPQRNPEIHGSHEITKSSQFLPPPGVKHCLGFGAFPEARVLKELIQFHRREFLRRLQVAGGRGVLQEERHLFPFSLLPKPRPAAPPSHSRPTPSSAKLVLNVLVTQGWILPHHAWK